jgi:CheY-like chemotaxis protein
MAPRTRPAVLVVDDHPLNRRLLGEILRLEELDVAEAGTIAEARRLLRLEPPAGIVVDIHLPDGSGLELVRDCRRDPRTAGCAIVACTAADADGGLAAHLAGCDAYVTKPIDTWQFARLVTALIGERPDLQRFPGAVAAGPVQAGGAVSLA